MADEYTVEISGAKELRRALKGMKDELRDLSALHRQIANMVLGAIRAETPRGDTGDLQASLKANGTRTKANVKTWLIYAPVIHYGWPYHQIAPNPYGDRGRAGQRGAIESAYRTGIAKIVDKVQI